MKIFLFCEFGSENGCKARSSEQFGTWMNRLLHVEAKIVAFKVYAYVMSCQNEIVYMAHSCKQCTKSVTLTQKFKVIHLRDLFFIFAGLSCYPCCTWNHKRISKGTLRFKSSWYGLGTFWHEVKYKNNKTNSKSLAYIVVFYAHLNMPFYIVINVFRRLKRCVVGSADWDQVQINTFSWHLLSLTLHQTDFQRSSKSSVPFLQLNRLQTAPAGGSTLFPLV